MRCARVSPVLPASPMLSASPTFRRLRYRTAATQTSPLAFLARAVNYSKINVTVIPITDNRNDGAFILLWDYMFDYDL